MSDEQEQRRAYIKELLRRQSIGDEDAVDELAELLDQTPPTQPLTPERNVVIERIVGSMAARENLSPEQQQNARTHLQRASDEQLIQWEKTLFRDAVAGFERDHGTTLTHGQGEPVKKWAGDRDAQLARKHPEWSPHTRLAVLGRELEERESPEAHAHRVIRERINRQRAMQGIPVDEEDADDSADAAEQASIYDRLQAEAADYEASVVEGMGDRYRLYRARTLDEVRKQQMRDAEHLRKARGG